MALVLVLAALVCTSVTASAGPLFREAVADASLRLVLDAVPPGTSANAAPVVRLTGGLDPRIGRGAELVDTVASVPGAESVRITTQSISTELNPRPNFDPVGPVVTGPAGTAPVRLFGVEGPVSRVVVAIDAQDGAPGVWLPEPVAQQIGAAVGDQVVLGLSGRPEPVRTTSTRVAGVYRVEGDKRTPQEAPGGRTWADVAIDVFPSDAELRSERAHLAVVDLTTAAELARAIEDDLLWSTQARLDLSDPRLEQLHRTADAVLDLRRDIAIQAGTEAVAPALRSDVASGIGVIVDDADELAAAARRGAQVTTLVGLLLSIVLVGAAAAYTMVRRRSEVRLAAGTGRPPASVGGLHAVELGPAALVAWPVGWLVAQLLVARATGSASRTPQALAEAAGWSAGALAGALLAAGAVAAAATQLEVRRLRGHEVPRVPWVLVVVAVAATATAGLLSRGPGTRDTLGPLDLLVPPLLMAALAAIGSRLVFAWLGRRSGSSRPTRGTLVRWLAWRRLRAPDRAREATVTVAATGLAMLVFSLSSLGSLERTVEDRAAVAAGAATVDRVTHSWRLDPTAPRQAARPEDGGPLPPEDAPVGRNPQLPAGQSVVWRGRSTFLGAGESVEILVVDPEGLAAAAAWGAPEGPVAATRAMLPALADDADAAAARLRGFAPTPPALLVGQPGDLDLRVGDTVTVDTLQGPLSVRVAGTPPLFPGTGTNRVTLIVPANGFFAGLSNEDPRLRPGPDARQNRPIDFQADLWSASGEAAAATLARFDVPRNTIASTALARTSPAYVAAGQARRYAVVVGAVFGTVGLAAVVLLGIRSARRSPAADRMLAWSSSGRDTPGRARAVELVAVTVLTAALAGAALTALRPLAATLLEPGDGLAPDAVLWLPPSALAVGATWVLAVAAAAVVATILSASSQPAVEVLRGED